MVKKERYNEFMNEIKRKSVRPMPKRERVQNEWDKQKWKVEQIERGRAAEGVLKTYHYKYSHKH